MKTLTISYIPINSFLLHCYCMNSIFIDHSHHFREWESERESEGEGDIYIYIFRGLCEKSKLLRIFALRFPIRLLFHGLSEIISKLLRILALRFPIRLLFHGLCELLWSNLFRSQSVPVAPIFKVLVFYMKNQWRILVDWGDLDTHGQDSPSLTHKELDLISIFMLMNCTQPIFWRDS